MEQWQENRKPPAKWSGSFGFIMVSAGAAVGMGNLWRFPMLVGENGGGAFVLVYLVCACLIGVPLLIAEIAIGRHSGRDVYESFRQVSPKWGGAGLLAVATSLIGLAYYSVLGGWVLRYLLGSAASVSRDSAAFFEAFTASSAAQPAWYLLYMAATVCIVMGGIRKGIEKACRIMMPLLFACLLVLAIRSCSLPGAGEGIRFFLRPDFSLITPKVWLMALGQVFFSLSIGAGAGVTYGSYLGKKERIVRSACVVAGFDTLAAMLAGFAILPAVFAMGRRPQMGPGLLFVVLPEVFAGIPGGQLFFTAFFLLVLFASLTTTIAFLEVVVAFAVRAFHIGRKKAALLCGGAAACLGIPCALSFGVLGEWRLFGKTLFELADYFVSNFSLPVAAILTCLFIGWVWKPINAVQEITNGGTLRFRLAGIWSAGVRFALPVCIFFIFLFSLEIL